MTIDSENTKTDTTIQLSLDDLIYLKIVYEICLGDRSKEIFLIWYIATNSIAAAMILSNATFGNCACDISDSESRKYCFTQIIGIKRAAEIHSNSKI